MSSSFHVFICPLLLVLISFDCVEKNELKSFHYDILLAYRYTIAPCVGFFRFLYNLLLTFWPLVLVDGQRPRCSAPDGYWNQHCHFLILIAEFEWQLQLLGECLPKASCRWILLIGSHWRLELACGLTPWWRYGPYLFNASFPQGGLRNRLGLSFLHRRWLVYIHSIPWLECRTSKNKIVNMSCIRPTYHMGGRVHMCSRAEKVLRDLQLLLRETEWTDLLHGCGLVFEDSKEL